MGGGTPFVRGTQPDVPNSVRASAVDLARYFDLLEKTLKDNHAKCLTWMKPVIEVCLLSGRKVLPTKYKSLWLHA